METTLPTVAPVSTEINRIVVPLGDTTIAPIDNLVTERLRANRLCVAHSVEADNRHVGVGLQRYTEWEKYGKKSYPRDRNRILIHSCAHIHVDGALQFEFARSIYTIRAPRGYRWDCDVYGIRLVHVRSGADYHPTAADLLEPRPAQYVAKMLRRLESDRRKIAREKLQAARDNKRAAERRAKLMRQAARLGIYVCFADSRRAGNCAVGTARFAQSADLDTSAHYPIDTIRKFASRDTRIQRAIDAAVTRSCLELDRGYCTLADHQPY